MKILPVDEKWSIAYDDTNNDRPSHWLRYFEPHDPWSGNNAETALFYALLGKTDANTR